MTLDKRQPPARVRTTRLCTATAAALTFGLPVFSSLSYGQTVAGTESILVAQADMPRTAADDPSVRPFKVQIPQAALDDLRRRIAATRWPDKETATDQSQGAQLAKLQELVQYWGSGYDWRKVETKMNALPQFTTNIDGVDIHFIHASGVIPSAHRLSMASNRTRERPLSSKHRYVHGARENAAVPHALRTPPHCAVNPTRRRPGRHRRTGGRRMTNTAVTGAAFDIDGGPQLVDGGTARAGETPWCR